MAELRFALRRILRRPAASALIVLVMALGIGLSGTVFSTAWGLLWRGLDIDAGGGELLRLAADTGDGLDGLPWDVFVDLRDDCRSCEVGVWLPIAVDVGRLDLYPERLNGAQVSAGTLELLDVEPLLGRLFTPDEERREAPVAVVGERLWRQQLGGTSEALGRTITVYRQEMTVIGVVPEGVRAPYNQELWTPIRERTARTSPWMQAVARVGQDTSRESLRQRLGRHLENHGVEARKAVVESFEQAYHDDTLRRSLHLALVAALLVLLVSSANAAGLLMARGLERSRELAIRRALGADRPRLLRLLVLEVALLAAAAGALGLLLVPVGIRLYEKAGPVQGPYWMDVRFDLASIVFTSGVTLIAALAAGLLPAWLGSGDRSLRAGRGTSMNHANQAWQHRLVIGQVALGTVLAAGAWWLAGAMDRLGGPLEPLRRDDVVVLQSSTYGSEHAVSPAASESYWRRVLDELEALPQVRSAAIAPVPGVFDGTIDIHFDSGNAGDEERAVVASHRLVTPGAFEALGLPLLAGRDFRPDEAADIAVVDSHLAEHHFEGDAIGRSLRIDTRDGERTLRVIGVVAELSVPSATRGAIYRPAFAARRSAHTVALRLHAGALTPQLELDVREAMTRVDPQAAVYWVETMRHWMDHQLRHATRASTLFTAFAAMTLLLVASGLHGTLLLFVQGHRRELAIRQALGALPRALRRLVFSRGLLRVGIGVSVGSALAFWLFRALGTIFGEAGSTLPILLQAAVTLLACGLLASLLPARRAGAVDVARGLREQ